MSQQKIKGLSKKYCHPEFISASIESRHAELDSASIEHRHAERGCLQPNSASLVQGRFRVRPGMTAAANRTDAEALALPLSLLNKKED